MSSPSITLIISTYNFPEALNRVLASIASGTELPEEIVICDDGSGPETKTVIDQWRDKIPTTIIHTWQEDQGFRKNRILNLSLSKSSANYVVFLDGDCIPSKQFVADHRKLAEDGYFLQGRRAFIAEESVPALLANQTTIGALTIRGKVSGLFKSIRLPHPLIKVNRSHRGIIGCNLAAWRRDIEEVNGFDEVYEGWGIGEDSDLGARFYNKGLSRKFVYGRALVFHLNHQILPRDHVENSKARLLETIESGKVRCTDGLDNYL